MRKIEAVILDWAGTLVDYSCKATEDNYRQIFAHYNIELTTKEIRAKMGIEKVDHIRAILESDRVSKLWYKNTGMEPNEGDVRELNRAFDTYMLENLETYSAPKEYVRQTLETLRESGIKIGSTTSYSTDIMEHLTAFAATKGVYVDCWINSEQVKGQGRPNPYMIFKNMEKLGATSVRNVIKAGDTVNDIKEGLNAGVTAVGIIEGSSEMGLSQEEFDALSEKEKAAERKRVHDKFKQAGADYIINNFSSLPYIVAQLQNRKL